MVKIEVSGERISFKFKFKKRIWWKWRKRNTIHIHIKIPVHLMIVSMKCIFFISISNVFIKFLKLRIIFHFFLAGILLLKMIFFTINFLTDGNGYLPFFLPGKTERSN